MNKFNLTAEMHERLKNYATEIRLAVLDAILSFMFDDYKPQLSEQAESVFQTFAKELHRRKQNSINGRKGGAPKGNKNACKRSQRVQAQNAFPLNNNVSSTLKNVAPSASPNVPQQSQQIQNIDGSGKPCMPISTSSSQTAVVQMAQPLVSEEQFAELQKQISKQAEQIANLTAVISELQKQLATANAPKQRELSFDKNTEVDKNKGQDPTLFTPENTTASQNEVQSFTKEQRKELQPTFEKWNNFLQNKGAKTYSKRRFFDDIYKFSQGSVNIAVQKVEAIIADGRYNGLFNFQLQTAKKELYRNTPNEATNTSTQPMSDTAKAFLAYARGQVS